MKNLRQWGRVNNLLSHEFLTKLDNYHKIYIGYSAGIDSSVLLHSLYSVERLRTRLIAVHINHGLSPHADKWESLATKLCNNLNVKIIVKKVCIDTQNNLEEKARDLRYQIFAELIDAKSCLILAHHQDDQAETVLLHLFRGAGIGGLSAMSCEKEFYAGIMFRPFLEHDKKLIQQYAKMHSIEHVIDESNFDDKFSRNFIRNKILPIISLKWPKVINNITNCAKNFYKEKENLIDLAYIDCPSLKNNLNVIDINEFAHLPVRRIINIVRVWLVNNKMKPMSQKNYNILLNEIIGAQQDKSPCLLFNNYEIRRFKNFLYLTEKNILTKNKDIIWDNFPNNLYITKDSYLMVEILDDTFNFDNINITIRFRKGGELILSNGMHKEIKKLMQYLQILPWQRENIPFVYVNDKLIQIGNFLGDYALNYSQFNIKWVHLQPITLLPSSRRIYDNTTIN